VPSPPAEIRLIVNWFDELRARARNGVH
jgi:hypothetical protein